jgi:hypothetical protein
MTEHSPSERAGCGTETVLTMAIDAGRYASISDETGRAFEPAVAAAPARDPLSVPNRPHPSRKPHPLEADGRVGPGGRS